MFDRIIYPRTLNDLGEKNEDIKTGIVFSEDKEYFFLYVPNNSKNKPLMPIDWLFDKSSRGKNDSLEFKKQNKAITPNDWYFVEFFGRASHGVSIGDYIADDCKYDCKSIGLIEGINPTNLIECCSAIIENLLINKPKPDAKNGLLEWAQLAYKQFHILTMYTQVGEHADNPVKYDRCNIVILPLLAEVLMEIRDCEYGCTFEKSKRILESMETIRSRVKRVVSELLNNQELIDSINDANILEDEYGIETLRGDTKFYKNRYTNMIKPPLEDLYIPASASDFISYLLHQYVRRGYYFIKCSNCNRYFTYHTDSKIRYCSRYVENPSERDIGKRCNDIGRLRARSRWLSTNEVVKLFQSYYSRVLYMKKTGKISPAQFEKWSLEARAHRDDCLAEKMSFDEFKKWLDAYEFN